MERASGPPWKLLSQLGLLRKGTLPSNTSVSLPVHSDVLSQALSGNIRFPCFMGLSASTRPACLRCLAAKRGGSSTPNLVDGKEIKREKKGRKYSIITREYMAQGHDGFVPLKGNKYLIDDEVGQIFNTLVR